MSECINLHQIEELKSILGADFQGLIDEFLRDSQARLTRALAALGEGNWEVARREFHTLKGSCGNIGAERLSDMCQHLEWRLKQGDCPSTQQSSNELQIEYQRVRQALSYR